jgi:ribonuclease HII
MTASLHFEEGCWIAGYQHVIGVDEVGRGTWAGPVAAGAVCLPHDRTDLLMVLKGVRDSKQMTPRQRENLVDRIKETAVAWGIGSATSAEIDAYGIVPATRLAMERAIEATKLQADYLLLDSIKWIDTAHIRYQSIVRGDTLSLSIASASVLAKVWRDDYMRQLDEDYPQYSFGQHKGYGTAKHSAALHEYGACEEHRQSFAPLRHLAAGTSS